LALSPAALQQDIGLKRSTYRDHFTDLVNKGYLVQGTGNTWEFYERPQVRDIANNGLNQNEMAATANQIDEKACDALNAQQGADSVS
jgi:DNA-binding IclR family transcriptional regulator